MKILSEEIEQNFSEQVRAMRLFYGLTQVQLSERMGVSFATINRWENGQNSPLKLYWNKLKEIEGVLSHEKEKNT